MWNNSYSIHVWELNKQWKYEKIILFVSPETGSTLNLPLALALKEVLDLSQNLQESEIQIKNLISKYIKNETVESDLGK